jgi:hypothetical protein
VKVPLANFKDNAGSPGEPAREISDESVQFASSVFSE